MEKFHQARIVLLVSIVLTALLYVIPQAAFLVRPFMLFSTVAHELGHGVAAILVGGSFESYRFWPDGSGVANIGVPRTRLAQALTSAGGLVGPAVAAALGFALGRTKIGARRSLIGLAVILLLSLIFVVRNGFGFFYVTLLLGLVAVVAVRSSGEVAQLVLVFLSVQLALSVFTRGDYLFTPVAETSAGVMRSDVGKMADALFLPFWFWGGVCGLISILALLYGLKVYWK